MGRIFFSEMGISTGTIGIWGRREYLGVGVCSNPGGGGGWVGKVSAIILEEATGIVAVVDSEEDGVGFGVGFMLFFAKKSFFLKR